MFNEVVYICLLDPADAKNEKTEHVLKVQVSFRELSLFATCTLMVSTGELSI
jgi:hypothetical protein